jgi:hypothetical protein
MNKHRCCVKVGADVIYFCRQCTNKTGASPPLPLLSHRLPRSCPPLRYANTPPNLLNALVHPRPGVMFSSMTMTLDLQPSGS